MELPDRILWVGRTSDIPREYAKAPAIDLQGRQCVTAGFVDCHTHLVFAGDRSEEFALRCGGMGYEEIAQRGGGIQTTVNATRQATTRQLVTLAVQCVEEALRFGVRTLEIKSGYGLDYETELKQLRVAQLLKKRFPQVRFSVTFLGAHAIPQGLSRGTYVREICERMLPEIARRKLADCCDIFIDRGYFSLEEGRKILGRARELGLAIKVHADELANTESASFAAEMGAWSADHLLQISDAGVQALSQSDTVSVLLPATAFFLKAQHAPARRLLDAGARVALSTDFNPGTSMTLNLPLVMTLGALYLGMTREEILCSVTYNAARALRLHGEQGTLEAGLEARFSVHPFERFEEVYYRFGW
jgi:imidazolonepropionase